MADFGVYFEVTNHLGVPMYYLKSDLVDGTYDGPASIASDGQPHLVHLDDPYAFRGAEGTVYFTADVNGELRQYAWYGTCPVWSSANGASGPGVLRFNASGHPLTVTVAMETATPGWTPVEQLIQHVFLLMLENRSFDHMLGFSKLTGTDAVTLQPTAIVGLKGTEENAAVRTDRYRDRASSACCDDGVTRHAVDGHDERPSRVLRPTGDRGAGVSANP